MTWPFKKRKTKKLPWKQPDTQWGVGDKAVRTHASYAGNDPPKGKILTVSAVREGRVLDDGYRTVALFFADWPAPINTDYSAWNGNCFRKVIRDGTAEKSTETIKLDDLLKVGETA